MFFLQAVDLHFIKNIKADHCSFPGNEIAVIRKCSKVFLALTPEMWELLRETGKLQHLQELLVNGQAPRTLNLTTIVCSCPNLRSLNIVRGLNITMVSNVSRSMCSS